MKEQLNADLIKETMLSFLTEEQQQLLKKDSQGNLIISSDKICLTQFDYLPKTKKVYKKTILSKTDCQKITCDFFCIVTTDFEISFPKNTLVCVLAGEGNIHFSTFHQEVATGDFVILPAKTSVNFNVFQELKIISFSQVKS